MVLKRVLALSVIAMVAMGLTACERKITRIELASGPLTCAECHDGSNVITGKQAEWSMSLHGTGLTYEEEGGNPSCAGCHSGHAFQVRIAAGQSPNQVTQGDTDPTPMDCRACHMIHDTYTMQDFALRTTAPVAFYAITGKTFDGGEGNLCANCHQPRRDAPVATNGTITGISSHWGPHHGPQSAMLMGLAGAGVTSVAAGHYQGVSGTCVTCHMGDGLNHTMEPSVATCKKCHTSATNFDVDGVQTEIAALGDSLGEYLVAAGLIDQNNEDGHPIVTSAPEARGKALWNWLYVMHEDKSHGVHNPAYARAMLQYGISVFTATGPEVAAKQ